MSIFDNFSQPFTSLFSVPSTPKGSKSALQAGGPNDLTSFADTFVTKGYGERVQDATAVAPVDFYRDGDAGSDQLPRFLDDQQDDQPASIRMLGTFPINGPGPAVDLLPPYTKFFLETVQEGHTERHQIVETFGDFYVFFFGERPPIYTFSGTLVNANNINWSQDFMFYYDKFLRGTKCVDLGATLYLTYDYNQVQGFLLNVSTSKTAANPKSVGVQFQVLIIDRKILKLSADFGLINANGQAVQDQQFLQLLTKGLSAETVSNAYGIVNLATSKTAPAAAGSLGSSNSLPLMKQTFSTPMGLSPTGTVVVA